MNAYYSEEFLADAVSSVLEQSMQDWEIILWENVSTSAKNVVDNLDDSRIRYFHTPDKVSLYESRVSALSQAQGEFLAFLDCDDVWLPDKLRSQLGVFDNEECVISCSDYFVFRGGHLQANWREQVEIVETYRSVRRSPIEVALDYRVGMSTVIIRKQAVDRIWSGSVPEYSIIEDFDMVVRLLSRGWLIPVPEPLSVYRKHGSNFSNRLDVEADEWMHWINHEDALVMEPDCRVQIYETMSERLLRLQIRQARLDGNRAESWRMLGRLPWGPFKIKYLISYLLPTKWVCRWATRI